MASIDLAWLSAGLCGARGRHLLQSFLRKGGAIDLNHGPVGNEFFEQHGHHK